MKVLCVFVAVVSLYFGYLLGTFVSRADDLQARIEWVLAGAGL